MFEQDLKVLFAFICFVGCVVLYCSSCVLVVLGPIGQLEN